MTFVDITLIHRLLSVRFCDIKIWNDAVWVCFENCCSCYQPLNESDWIPQYEKWTFTQPHDMNFEGLNKSWKWIKTDFN